MPAASNLRYLRYLRFHPVPSYHFRYLLSTLGKEGWPRSYTAKSTMGNFLQTPCAFLYRLPTYLTLVTLSSCSLLLFWSTKKLPFRPALFSPNLHWHSFINDYDDDETPTFRVFFSAPDDSSRRSAMTAVHFAC